MYNEVIYYIYVKLMSMAMQKLHTLTLPEKIMIAMLITIVCLYATIAHQNRERHSDFEHTIRQLSIEARAHHH